MISLVKDTINNKDIDKLIDWLKTYPRLTKGKVTLELEEKWSKWLGTKYSVFCNSGSSANLLAITSLTSEKLGPNRLRPGDEIITVAAGFPTTVNPIIQNGLIPVFIDTELGTYNPSINCIEQAISTKTKGIFINCQCF